MKPNLAASFARPSRNSARAGEYFRELFVHDLEDSGHGAHARSVPRSSRRKAPRNIRLRGAELRDGLAKLAAKFGFIREIRGEGLMIGVELSIHGAPFVSEPCGVVC